MPSGVGPGHQPRDPRTPRRGGAGRATSLVASDRSGIDEVLASDAVVLFGDRAGAARPDFLVTADNADAVSRICRRVDGIPLAVELAAARVRMLSVDQILDRLDDCFGLLTGGARTQLPRHKTLRAAMDWSYDLLSEAEQAALRRLAVFPERFDLDAADAVVTLGEHEATTSLSGLQSIDLVGHLVDKSLVVVEAADAGHRYRLLEPIRQFAFEKLAAAGELDLARRRHRDVFLARTEPWRSEWEVPSDQADLRAALEWSWDEGDGEAALRLLVAQFPYWFWAGYPDALQWLERVLAESEPAEHPARAIALGRLALVLHDSGRSDLEREERLVREAVAMASRLDDPDALTFTSWAYAELLIGRGRTAEALQLLERALQDQRASASPARSGWCHFSIGWIGVAERDLERARANFERASQLSSATDGQMWMRIHALAALAPVTVLLGEPERGLGLAAAALAGARSAGSHHVLLMALTGAADTAVLAGALPRAQEVTRELLAALREQTSARWVADALETAALVLESQDDHEAAAEALGAAEVLREAAGSGRGGTRAIAADVQRAHEQLAVELGAGRFTLHRARGSERSAHAALGEVLARLGEPRR